MGLFVSATSISDTTYICHTMYERRCIFVINIKLHSNRGGRAVCFVCVGYVCVVYADMRGVQCAHLDVGQVNSGGEHVLYSPISDEGNLLSVSSMDGNREID